MDCNEAAAGFALLAEPNRLRILARLSREGEQSATQLLATLPVTQPTLSHHMKLLCRGGLVRQRRDRQRVLYRLDREALERLLASPMEGEAPEPEPETPAFAGAAGVIVRSGHKW